MPVCCSSHWDDDLIFRTCESLILFFQDFDQDNPHSASPLANGAIFFENYFLAASDG